MTDVGQHSTIVGFLQRVRVRERSRSFTTSSPYESKALNDNKNTEKGNVTMKSHYTTLFFFKVEL